MSRTWKTVAVVAVVVVVAAGAGLWWFFSGDAPEEVSLESATAGVSTETTSSSPDDTTAGGEGLDGTWVVDTATGDFDFESATGTFVGFRIEEELTTIGSTTAVGRTGDVTGSMTIDGSTVTEASFDIDLATLTTNEERRDDKVQEALETSDFPTATFTLTEPIELGPGATDGEPVTATATGELTLHGVTRSVEFPLEAQLVDGTAVVVGSTEIAFADFDVEVPSAPVVLSVGDTAVLELQLLLTPG